LLKPRGRILISTLNPLWTPLLRGGARVGLCTPDTRRNFVTGQDAANLLRLNGFEVIKLTRRTFLPKNIPVLAPLVNLVAAQTPVLRRLCMTEFLVGRLLGAGADYSVSVVIPCYNEAENIESCVSRVPRMGKDTEVLVVDDGSGDGTAELVRPELNPEVTVRCISYRPNQGKLNAVRTGFDAARCDILMILDADMTVPPEDLPCFYRPLREGVADFINGTRLIYPLATGAMKLQNFIGNKLFGVLVSWLTGIRLSDTLCGTKAFFREDYRHFLMGYDPWGDFDFLFGAAQQTSKLLEVPIHYEERRAGQSKMKALRHTWALLKACWRAFWRVKYPRSSLGKVQRQTTAGAPPAPECSAWPFRASADRCGRNDQPGWVLRLRSSWFRRSLWIMPTVVITGSGGLVGSGCVELLCARGWDVVGVDNNLRAHFFGELGSVAPMIQHLCQRHSRYRHREVDIRDRAAIRDLFRDERPDFVIHTAAQPSHDKAREIPYEDFDVNAVGTLNLLVAAHDFCRDSPFCFTSTNKVYGDRPNQLPLIEKEKRYDYADGREGIDEAMSVDACLHSLFGASKLAADVLAQEYGRYFQMPVGVFRGGCLTGPQHAAVPLHGYLAYICYCAVHGLPYTVLGYRGKQVRDQIHCSDIARLFLAFYEKPRCGEVYNLGGGRANSVSIVETIDVLAAMGHRLRWTYEETNRVGDHVCYITDLAKVRAHFPAWDLELSLAQIFEELVVAARSRTVAG
jgi:CDP-paratose 2-epimerase